MSSAAPPACCLACRQGARCPNPAPRPYSATHIPCRGCWSCRSPAVPEKVSRCGAQRDDTSWQVTTIRRSRAPAALAGPRTAVLRRLQKRSPSSRRSSPARPAPPDQPCAAARARRPWLYGPGVCLQRSAGPVGGLGALGCRRAMKCAADGSGEAKMESFEEQSCNSNGAPTSPHPSCNRPLPEAPAGADPRRFF